MERVATDVMIRPLTLEYWPALEELFGATGASNGCWCMYWRIGPRYKDRPRHDNKGDLRQLAGSGQPPGLLAFDGQVPVGWCELAPRADLGWLARARYLEPAGDLPVWSVPCFYIRRSHRRQGVMGALIAAAVTAAAAAGAPALEAYPVDTAVPGHTGNLFPGTVAAFARHGFEVVARRKPDRPVMRRTFSGDEKSLAGSSLPVPGHHGSTPVSKRVMARIRLPARVRTYRPAPWRMPAGTRR